MARVLFGEHRTQVPAIERLIDAKRFEVAFGFEGADFSAFDLVVPLRVEEIAAARLANESKRRAVVPTDALVEQCDDKLLFVERLVALGFADAVPAVLPEPPTRYPYVRKARRGDWGQGIRIVRHAGEDDAPPPDSFAQEAVKGADEYVLHLLRVDGRVRYSLCYRYDMGQPLSVRGQADAYRAMAPADPGPVLPLCERVLNALGFEGTCCFNYKSRDGQPLFLELNPRFGGSLVGDVNGYLQAYLAAL